MVLAFVLEAVLEIALIPWWGYLGACTGSLVAEVVFAVAGLTACQWRGAGRSRVEGPGTDFLLAGAGMAAVSVGRPRGPRSS